jgi:hypothetical protein
VFLCKLVNQRRQRLPIHRFYNHTGTLSLEKNTAVLPCTDHKTDLCLISLWEYVQILLQTACWNYFFIPIWQSITGCYSILTNNKRISAGLGAKLFKGVLWRHNCKMGEADYVYVDYEAPGTRSGLGARVKMPPSPWRPWPYAWPIFFKIMKIKRNIHLPSRFERLTKYDIFLDRSIH